MYRSFISTIVCAISNSLSRCECMHWNNDTTCLVGEREEEQELLITHQLITIIIYSPNKYQGNNTKRTRKRGYHYGPQPGLSRTRWCFTMLLDWSFHCDCLLSTACFRCVVRSLLFSCRCFATCVTFKLDIKREKSTPAKKTTIHLRAEREQGYKHPKTRHRTGTTKTRTAVACIV